MDLVPLPPKPPKPTLQQERAQAGAMLRISNVIAAEMSNVQAEHWRRALETTARGLRESVQRSGYRPSLGEAG